MLSALCRGDDAGGAGDTLRCPKPRSRKYTDIKQLILRNSSDNNDNSTDSNDNDNTTNNNDNNNDDNETH